MYQNQSGLREPYVYYQDALFIALSTIPSNIVAAVMFKALGAKILLGLALPHTIHYAFKRVIHEVGLAHTSTVPICAYLRYSCLGTQVMNTLYQFCMLRNEQYLITAERMSTVLLSSFHSLIFSHATCIS